MQHFCVLAMFYGLSTFFALSLLDKTDEEIFASKWLSFFFVYFPGVNTIFSLTVGVNILKEYILE